LTSFLTSYSGIFLLIQTSSNYGLSNGNYQKIKNLVKFMAVCCWPKRLSFGRKQ